MDYFLLRYGIEDVGKYVQDTSAVSKYYGVLTIYGATPYNELLFKYFTYVGDDYVSLVYNDVSYMGGAHPYSALEGITIDCITGEIVSVQQFLDDSTSEIGEQLQKVLGFNSFTPDNWDYYITDTTVVFFYDDPKYWDPVVTRRRR